jgi:iron-sulfur cluster assembly accessory protein
MTKRLFTSLNKFPITITNNAWEKMSQIIEQKNMEGFMFSAISGGCNGLNYDLKLIDSYKVIMEQYTNNGKTKISVMENNNNRLYIDPLSEMFLFGTTIDYILEDYDKGLFENKFVFIVDKNFASSCGCGVSFTPKENF